MARRKKISVLFTLGAILLTLFYPIATI